MDGITGNLTEDTKELVEKSNVFIEYLYSLVPQAFSFALNVIISLILYLVGMKVISFARKVLNRMMDRSRLDAGVKSFLDSLAKFIMYFLLVVFILTRFGVATASVTAVVGSAGLALGLAMQGSLANFAGGVLILVMKPFELGDYIITDSGEGTVSQIQICYTRLVTIDNCMVVIPNGKLSDGVITNVTKMEKRRIDFTFGISYDSDLKLAKDTIREVFEAEPGRLPEDIEIYVDSLGESEVVLGARIWVKTEDYWPLRFKLTEEILCAFKEKGITIPFPQMEVTLHK